MTFQMIHPADALRMVNEQRTRDLEAHMLESKANESSFSIRNWVTSRLVSIPVQPSSCCKA